MIKTQLKISLLAFVVLVAFSPQSTRAAELSVEPQRTEIGVGEQFLVNVVVDSQESLNVVGGQLVFPPEVLNVADIRHGNSVINFWIERPEIIRSGAIKFSGVTPGGFNGEGNPVFSVVFEATKESDSTIGLEQVRVLQNDGLGTEAGVVIHAALVSIRPGGNGIQKGAVVDTEPPESFVPEVSRDKTIFDGKYFLVFATQDKSSGVDHFAVREGRWGWYEVAESPYLLKHQQLDRDVYVKAVDNAGNKRVVMLPARVHRSWWDRYGLFAIIITVVFVMIVYKKAWRKFPR